MAYIRKLKSGKWQCLIRRKGYPYIAKSFLEKSTCSKYAKMIESQMDRKIFEDLSGAEGTTLRSYERSVVPSAPDKSSKIFLSIWLSIIFAYLLHVDFSRNDLAIYG